MAEKIFTYQAFGLTIDSCIEIPVWSETAGRADVSVRYDTVPKSLPGAIRKGVRYQVSRGRLWLGVDEVARYLVVDGREIIIDRHPKASDDDVRVFLLGPAIAALLHERAILVLNASSVEINGYSMAILGRSGSGKSTLAAGFFKRGYNVVTDGLCAVSLSEGTPRVLAGCPQILLWPDALKTINIDPDALDPIRPGLGKRILPLPRQRMSDSLPLKHMYLLGLKSKTMSAELEPQHGRNKFKLLGIHTYGTQFLEGLGTEMAYIKNLTILSKQVPLTLAQRTQWPNPLDELIDLLLEDFQA